MKIDKKEFERKQAAARAAGYLAGYTEALADFLKSTDTLAKGLSEKLAAIAAGETDGARTN